VIATATLCDKRECNGVALVRFVFAIGELEFCAHHAREVAAQIDAQDITVGVVPLGPDGVTQDTLAAA
jgi:hypothetical protein